MASSRAAQYTHCPAFFGFGALLRSERTYTVEVAGQEKPGTGTFNHIGCTTAGGGSSGSGGGGSIGLLEILAGLPLLALRRRLRVA